MADAPGITLGGCSALRAARRFHVCENSVKMLFKGSHGPKCHESHAASAAAGCLSEQQPSGGAWGMEHIKLNCQPSF